ncbi:MAG: hypothetical protein ACODAG_10775 [Myxococcota bacterium]
MEATTQESNGSLKDVAEQAAAERADQISEEKYRFERVLPVKLTEEQVADAAREMAEVAKQIDDLEQRKKELLAEMRTEMADLQGHLSGIAKKVRQGAVEDAVPCVQGLDYSEQHMITVRLDTGEVIERRPLTAEERQGEFDLSSADGEAGVRAKAQDDEDPGTEE